MRHVARIKKKPKLNSFTNIKQLLHSFNRKSTYFYKQWSSWTSACHNIFANGFRWSSRHCEQNSSGFRLRDGANPTRSSLAFKNPYSKNAYGRLGLNKSYILPVTCSLALLLVLGFSINPIAAQNNHQAFAETNASAQSSDIVPENGVALRIDTALNDKDTIEEQVTGSGTQYIKVDFTVGANNIQNYDVYVQADSTALTGQSHGDKLQSITSDSTGTVGTKQWGYSVSRGSVEPSTMTYRPIQTSVSTSADSQDAGEGNTLTSISQPYTLAFAANLEGAASDHYKSNITLSVAVGAMETAMGFGRSLYITDMQEMFDGVCVGAYVGDEGRLKDRRDDKIYWVAKMEDGNCWMTQNLDFDLKTTQTLTGADSDVVGNWTPPKSTQTTPNPNFSGSSTVQSWDPAQGGVATYCNDGTIAGKCKASGNPTTSVNNGHDAQGNYYSWLAVTAGAGNYAGTDRADVNSSICPKGWRLPTNTGSKSFYSLLKGLIVDNAPVEQILVAPYYFVYGGRATYSDLIGSGSSGLYWSGAFGSDEYLAYGLDFSTSINTNESFHRAGGLTVRCVAR